MYMSSFLQRLYESFEEEHGFFQFATAITSNDLEEIQKFLEAAVDTKYYFDLIVSPFVDTSYLPFLYIHYLLILQSSSSKS